MNCDKSNLLLYAVTDRRWLNEKSLYEAVRESLDGGVTFVQLREKDLDEENFRSEAESIKKLCHSYNVPFVIDDNVQLAIDTDADGVHVGQSDMEADDVRQKIGPDKILGVSAHNVEEAVLAEKMGADYLGVGAVFATGSKDDASVISFETLKDICKAVSIPVIGNGDVDSPQKAKALMNQTGCDAVMIGRAARGNPWIFREMNHYFQTGELLPRPTVEEIREMILRHTREQIRLKGEYNGIREMRKHVAWYTAGMRHSACLRRESNSIDSYEALEKLLTKLGEN